jgi:aryl-alcohol dehydrogenase-like predicted oxidoreductase
MRYQLLGRSGLRVSEICLGTMTFGEDWGWGSSKEESRGIYDSFRDLGGNFIDTANLYTNGTSEVFLGEFMQGHCDQVVLATKYTSAVPGKDPNAGHSDHLRQAARPIGSERGYCGAQTISGGDSRARRSKPDRARFPARLSR